MGNSFLIDSGGNESERNIHAFVGSHDDGASPNDSSGEQYQI